VAAAEGPADLAAEFRVQVVEVVEDPAEVGSGDAVERDPAVLAERHGNRHDLVSPKNVSVFDLPPSGEDSLRVPNSRDKKRYLVLKIGTGPRPLISDKGYLF
jgi:hypothetical protein